MKAFSAVAAPTGPFFWTILGDNYPWPGNVRELEQAVRRILLTRQYSGDAISPSRDPQAALVNGLETGRLTADQLLAGYCRLLYDQSQSYEEVARRTDLDYRTVKKYLAIKPL